MFFDGKNKKEAVITETKKNSQTEVENQIKIDQQIYIQDSSFNSNPLALLGQIIEIRKSNGQCPDIKNLEIKKDFFSAVGVIGYKIDKDSILKEPIKRKSIIIDNKVKANIFLLSYLSTSLDKNKIINTFVLDQSSGRVLENDKSWENSINTYIIKHTDLFKDNDVCYILVVKGFTQKNFTHKTYTSYKVQAKGGAYGMNIDGDYYYSNEDYQSDLIFGLSVAVLKRPAATKTTSKKANLMDLTKEEIELFKSLKYSKKRK